MKTCLMITVLLNIENSLNFTNYLNTRVTPEKKENDKNIKIKNKIRQKFRSPKR